MSEQQDEYDYKRVEYHLDVAHIRAWIKRNQKPIMAGITAVSMIKNHQLKKENEKLRKDLKKAAQALRVSTSVLDNMGLFEYYFGPRSPLKPPKG